MIHFYRMFSSVDKCRKLSNGQHFIHQCSGTSIGRRTLSKKTKGRRWLRFVNWNSWSFRYHLGPWKTTLMLTNCCICKRHEETKTYIKQSWSFVLTREVLDSALSFLPLLVPTQTNMTPIWKMFSGFPQKDSCLEMVNMQWTKYLIDMI